MLWITDDLLAKRPLLLDVRYIIVVFVIRCLDTNRWKNVDPLVLSNEPLVSVRCDDLMLRSKII